MRWMRMTSCCSSSRRISWRSWSPSWLRADQVVAVVHIDLLHLDAILQQQAILRTAELVVEGAGELVLGAACRAGIASGALTGLLVGQVEAVLGARMDANVVALEQRLQLANGVAVAVACLQVEFLQAELHIAGAAQLEAAGAQ